jgi:septum formation protein
MLVLASASPRRHELLLAIGIDHIVRPSSVPEHRHPGESPTEFVGRIAEDKARAVVSSPKDIALGADTVVCLDEEAFRKPYSDDDGARMLRRLPGRDHWIYTRIYILSGARRILDLSSMEVSSPSLLSLQASQRLRSFPRLPQSARWPGSLSGQRVHRTALALLKYEVIYPGDFNDRHQLRQALDGYFDFYNRHRPHQALQYRTPAELYLKQKARKNSSV